MPGKSARLELSREQILAYRREASSLNERLPASAKSLRLAAWAGLQDSMPRAALLSIHARVKGCGSNFWEHPSLVQLWGPRFNNYVVAAKDLPAMFIFSCGDQIASFLCPTQSDGQSFGQHASGPTHF